MEGIEMICFQIISNVGMARSSYIEAIHKAKAGEFEEAKKSIAEGEAQFLIGHEVHRKLLTEEANGKPAGSSLLLLHAEDQLMSAEGFKIIAQEMMDCYQRITDLEHEVRNKGGAE